MRRRGRAPRVEGQPSRARIWAFVTAGERADLQSVAAANGYADLSSFIRDAVNSAVADYRDRPVFGKRTAGGLNIRHD